MWPDFGAAQLAAAIAEFSHAAAPLRRAAGSGGGMSPVSGRTRLGPRDPGRGRGSRNLGRRAVARRALGLNALLCTAGLVAAAAGLARRHRVAVSSDAPWLAAVALLIASNFVARDSGSLHAFDAIGLVIVLAVAAPSIQGVGLRGRQAWHYLRAGWDAAVSAWIGVFPAGQP